MSPGAVGSGCKGRTPSVVGARTAPAGADNPTDCAVYCECWGTCTDNVTDKVRQQDDKRNCSAQHIQVCRVVCVSLYISIEAVPAIRLVASIRRRTTDLIYDGPPTTTRTCTPIRRGTTHAESPYIASGKRSGKGADGPTPFDDSGTVEIS